MIGSKVGAKSVIHEKNMIEFWGLWEQLNNQNFKGANSAPLGNGKANGSMQSWFSFSSEDGFYCIFQVCIKVHIFIRLCRKQNSLP